jgi:hypothetical protein|tara:strand:+ start:60 stop:464 length:405 start_codon:yes stop_codon:yes gene_type:complete
MGNRAVIAFEKQGKRDKKSVGIYLHWNGGRDSVEGFLEAAKRYGVRGGDSSYCVARLAQIIGNTFGGTLSVGVGIVENLDCDNYDNGLYWVNNDFEIVGREFNRGKEQKEYKLEEFVAHVKEANDIHFQSKEAA